MAPVLFVIVQLIVPAQQVRLCVDGAMIWIIKYPHMSQITLDPTRTKLHSLFNVHAVHVRTYMYTYIHACIEASLI